MTEPITKHQLAERHGVTQRTVERWVSRGCPSTGSGASRTFDPWLVQAWLNRQGISGRLGRPSHKDVLANMPASQDGGQSPLALNAKQNLARAELARKISIARKNELEFASEKALKDLGLDEKIREARSFDDLLRLNTEVAALLANGLILPSRGQAIQRLMSEARQNLVQQAQRQSEDLADERLLLCTEETGLVVQLLEGIVSEERRRSAINAVLVEARADLLENPNVGSGAEE